MKARPAAVALARPLGAMVGSTSRSGSNDLGFARTEHGYVPIISEYDQRVLHGGRFLPRLRTAYHERVVEEVTRRLHGTARRTVEGSVVKITVRF